MSGASGPSGAGTSVSISLEPVGTQPVAPTEVVLADWSFAVEAPGEPGAELLRVWRPQSGRPRIREGSWRGDDPTTPTLAAAGAFALARNLDLEARPWVVMELSYRCPQPLAPWAELRGAGGRVHRATLAEALEPTGSLVSTVRLWFGPTMGTGSGGGPEDGSGGFDAGASWSELRLGFDDVRPSGARQRLRVDLVGARLVASSPQHFFDDRERGPIDEEGMRLTFLDTGDARRAAVLGEGSVWAGRFPLERGLELRFDEGRPVDLPLGPGSSTLRIELEIDDDRQTVFEQRLDGTAAAGWHDHRIELDPWIDRALGEGLEVKFGEDAVLLATLEGSASGVHGLASLRAVRKAPSPPTIVLVTSDTHRGDYLRGSSPYGDAVTPVLDALGDRGVVFEQCLSTTNITNPSHVSLLTGIHPRDTGILDNQVILRNDARTLAETFRDQGFATLGLVAARHLGPSVVGLGQGFQHMAWSARSDPRDAEEQVNRMLAALPAFEGESLFCWLHLFDAHEPYGAPDPWELRYANSAVDPQDPKASREPLGSHQRPRWEPKIADADHVRSLYAGEVSYLDAELGRLLGAPRLRDAVVAITGDHGESLGERGLYWSHAGLHRASLHVPLILAGPGVSPGQVTDEPLRHLDLGRTLLDLAGCADVDFPGSSLLDASGRVPGADGNGLRYALGREAWLASVTRGNRHLVLALIDFREQQRWAHGEFRRHRAQLFDLGDDPDCERDLAPGHPAEVAELRGALVAWLRAGASVPGLAGSRRENPRLNAQLEALGYVVGADAEDRPVLFPGTCDCEECAAFGSESDGD